MKFQITFRETSDKDLIVWYKKTPKGDRPHIIRTALREFLKLGPKIELKKSNAIKDIEL